MHFSENNVHSNAGMKHVINVLIKHGFTWADNSFGQNAESILRESVNQIPVSFSTVSARIWEKLYSR